MGDDGGGGPRDEPGHHDRIRTQHLARRLRHERALDRARDARRQLCEDLVRDELGRRVRQLAHRNRRQPGVERADALVPHDVREGAQRALRRRRGVRLHAQLEHLERREQHRRRHLGGRRRSEHRRQLPLAHRVVAARLAQPRVRALLEELVPTELGGALQKVAQPRRADAVEEGRQLQQPSAGSVAVDGGGRRVRVVGDEGVGLHARLDDVERHHQAVRHRAGRGAGRADAGVVGAAPALAGGGARCAAF